MGVTGKFSRWGNSLALRIPKRVAQIAGAQHGTLVRIHAEPRKIVIDISRQAHERLDEMLARFDPALHGGEEMAFKPIGHEAPHLVPERLKSNERFHAICGLSELNH